jgi:dehydrogenase/reductase SDR family member 1
MSPRAGPEVAVVTGAARGIGRGIALALGDTGATVYVSDRESRGRRWSDLPGTVEDTAEQVTARGGTGVPVVVDHTDDAQAAALFARVADDHGALDLLVGNVSDGNALPFGPAPFWELPAAHWHNMFDSGVRAHVVAAQLATPLLLARPAGRRGTVVLTGYADGGDGVLANHLFYDLAMHATSRLAAVLAHELGPHGVTALAVSPGFTRTEAILAVLDEVPPGTASVEYPGRIVAALAADPDVARLAGRTVPAGDLARAYGIIDVDGTRPWQ